MSLVYLNGEYLPLENARISVLDRGFTFADSIYEVIPVFNRKIFQLDQHIQRLNHSLASIYMANPLDINEWEEIFIRLISESDVNNQFIYLHISRGQSERDHLIPDEIQPTIFVMCKPVKKNDRSDGIAAITHEDIRWDYCHIKSTALLASVILRHKASEKNAVEAILHKNNQVTEGAASNVFVVKKNQVYTPEKNNNILSGITRDLLVDLLNMNNIQCSEVNIQLEQLMDADEIWITSSTWEIVPVIKLDDLIIGNGKPGQIYIKAKKMYEIYKQSVTMD